MKHLTAALLLVVGVTSFAVPVDPKSKWELLANFSVARPYDLLVKVNNYRVQYSDAIEGMPAIGVSLALPPLTMNPIATHLFFELSYRFKSQRIPYLSPQGVEETGQFQLHYLPIAISVQADYLELASFMKPWIKAGTGLYWAMQRGPVEALRQDLWAPFWKLGFGVTFFSPSADSVDWLRGFNFGVSWENAFASEQVMKFWVLDLSVTFAL